MNSGNTLRKERRDRLSVISITRAREFYNIPASLLRFLRRASHPSCKSIQYCGSCVSGRSGKARVSASASFFSSSVFCCSHFSVASRSDISITNFCKK